MFKGIVVSILFLLLLIVIGTFLTYLVNSMLVPVFKTAKSIIPSLIKAMNLKDGETLVDLGSGDARILIAARKAHKIKGIGYEISPLVAYASRFNIWRKLGFRPGIQIKCENFLKADISMADVIYCNLNSTAMLLLRKRFVLHLKDEARVYSLGIEIPDVNPTQETMLDEIKLYLYKGSDIKKALT